MRRPNAAMIAQSKHDVNLTQGRTRNEAKVQHCALSVSHTHDTKVTSKSITCFWEGGLAHISNRDG